MRYIDSIEQLLDKSENFKDLRIILSGNKGNLGPIWQKYLENQGAKVYGFDYDENSEISITNANVRSLIDLKEFYNLYYRDTYEFGNGTLASHAPDIIINNAAIDIPPKTENISFFSDYKRTIETNLIGAINLTSLFLPDMLIKQKGLIINIGSIQGNVAADIRNYNNNFEKPVGYNVSKSALIQFTRSIAVQYGAYNIRSVCLSFSAVDTGKLDEKFKEKFKRCLPLKNFISYKSLISSLKFAIECPELTGTQILVDSGYTAW